MGFEDRWGEPDADDSWQDVTSELKRLPNFSWWIKMTWLIPLSQALHAAEAALIKVSHDLLVAADAVERWVLMPLQTAALLSTQLTSQSQSTVSQNGKATQTATSCFHIINRVSFGNAGTSQALLICFSSPGLHFSTHCFKFGSFLQGKSFVNTIVCKREIVSNCYADDTTLCLTETQWCW